MRKIKTVFDMIYDNHHATMADVKDASRWVFTEPNVLPTVKFDGTSTMIQNGQLFTRFDAKPNRQIPDNAIPCQPNPDPITGHWPHWVPVTNEPKFKWFSRAFNRMVQPMADGTYEIIGEHFQGNPYNIDGDTFVKHGSQLITEITDDFPTVWTKESFFKFFKAHENEFEGIVFYGANNKRAKLRMSDFGLKWN